MSGPAFDLFIIGAGSGGVRAARMAAQRGARVAVAEDAALGGTCVNVGCIPKKLYSFAAHYAESFEEAHGFGWSVGAPRFDWETSEGEPRASRSRASTASTAQLLDGRRRRRSCAAARASSAPHAVEVDGARSPRRAHRRRHRRLAGAARRPGRRARDQLERDLRPRALSRGAWSSSAAATSPASSRRSSTASAPQRDAALSRRADPARLRSRHPRLRRRRDGARRASTSASARRCARSRRRRRRRDARSSSRDGSALEADTVLYATGRAPNTAGLGLEAVGVALDVNGAVVVDDRYRSNVPSIYAIGDVIDRVQLTPVALAEAMALVDDLFGGGRAPCRLPAHPDRGVHPSEHRHDRPLRGRRARPLRADPRLPLRVQAAAPHAVGQQRAHADEARRRRRQRPRRRPAHGRRRRRRDDPGLRGGDEGGRDQGRVRRDARHPPDRRRGVRDDARAGGGIISTTF